MKLQNTFFTLLILFVFSQVCFGQEKPKAELIDKFSQIPADELFARIDVFMLEILKDNSSQGYVVIYPALDSVKKDFRTERRYESLINKLLYHRKFYKSRISITRSEEKQAVEFELWKVPIKAEKTFVLEDKWSEILPV